MGVCTGTACDFGRDYEIAHAPVMLEIERLVRGSDYGATSWTTCAQALRAARHLQLAPGLRLLEIGAGAGWPGLLLAAVGGCDVVLTDLPLSGLRAARKRAVCDGLAERCTLVAADGAAMPFPAALFDRVHHADVLCCLSAKRETLRECRRVARLGARMAFSVILLGRAPRDDGERALLQRSGPSHPDAECDYAELLRDAGWEPVECENVTAEFARCMDVLLAETAARHDALVALMGEQEAADRVVRRRSTREAVERGLLVRETFVAAARAVLDPA